MDIKEATQLINELGNSTEYTEIYSGASNQPMNAALEIAVDSMQKQEPTKPIHKEKNLYCPNCDHWLLWDDAIPNEWDNYCGICGQAIDWSEECEILSFEENE